VPKPSVADQDERPLTVAIAAVFGALLAAEVLFLGGMPLLSDAGLNRFTVVFLVLFVGAVAGSLMVVQGRRGGWIVLMIVASGGLAAVLILLLVLAALDVAGLAWVAVLLSVGPLSCLVLAPQRSVREWSRAGAARRSAGGRRRAAPSR
jgi:polyferredoxin